MVVLAGCGWTGNSSAPLVTTKIGQAGTSEWWRAVGGDTLDGYVREALENSPSIEVLAARVEVARAEAGLLAAPSHPAIDLEAGRQFGRRQEFETGDEPDDAMRYMGSASFAWEVDFWGRVKQLRQGARRNIDAALADENAGRLLLISEIARLDLARRRLAAEENVIAAVLAANDESVSRLSQKEGAGMISADVVDRQTAAGEELRQEIEEIRRQRRLAELALDRLLGRTPGAEPWPPAPAMGRLPAIPDVLETGVLAARPDIQAAAARVAASWHLSRAATLDLLPKLQFTGILGGRTMRLTPSIDEWIAVIAPTLEVPLWDAERLARAKERKARAGLAAAEYRENVLRALEETETALTNLSAHERILERARARVRSMRQVYQRSQERFTGGIISQLTVLEDQRRALEAERAALAAEESRLQAWIDLKKALGG